MRTIARLADARGTIEGKLLSILLSILLVASMFNVAVFTKTANAEEDEIFADTNIEAVSDVPADDATTSAETESTVTPAEEVTPTEKPATEAPAATEASATATEAVVAPAEQTAATTEAEPFEGYAYVDDIVVKVTADAGVVPAGTTVTATRVNSDAVKQAVESAVANEGKAIDDYKALDVTLIYDGVEIQPAGAVNVCFFNVNLSGADISVYHVTDDAATVTEVDTRQAEASVQSFDVSHFSIYVVTDKVNLVTYNFYNGADIVNTQIVAEGDKVLEPAAPLATNENEVFFGWTLDPNAETIVPFTFGEQGIVTEKATVSVYANFGKPSVINFCDTDGTIKATKVGQLGQNLAFENMTFEVASDKTITGYTNKQTGASYNVTDTILCDQSEINLTADLTSVYWVTYETGDDATIINPDSYEPGSPTIAPANPERQSYEFAGWVIKGSNPEITYSFNEKIDGNIDLVAKWTPTYASVRVIYWKQSLNDTVDTADEDKTYDYADSQVISDVYAPGETIDITKLDSSVLNNGGKINTTASDSNKTAWRGFRYNANTSGVTSNDETTKALADGTTVINVRYDRVTCYLKFGNVRNNKFNANKTVKGLFGQSLGENAWDTVYKYHPYLNSAADNALMLLTNFDFYTSGQGEYVSVDSTDGSLTLQLKQGDKRNTGGYTYYYNEKPNGSFELVATISKASSTKLTVNQKYDGYDLYKVYGTSQKISNPSYASTWEKNGLTVSEGDSIDGTYIYVVSTLKTHTIKYFDGSDDAAPSVDVKYKSALNGYNVEPVDEILTNHPGQEFAGWYKDPALSEPFDFENSTMPNSDLALYAKFVPVQFDLTFDTMGGSEGDSRFDDQRVDYGTKVGELPEPTKEGYTFGGWKYEGRPVSSETTITDNMNLVATWIPAGKVTVQYKQDDSAIEGLIDSKSYAGDASAVVLSPNANVSVPEGESFLYWVANDGLSYYPGSTVSTEIAETIEGTNDAVITLVPIFGAENSKAQLVYHANDGTDNKKSETVVNNALAEVKDASYLGIGSTNDYKFGWWSSEPAADNADNSYAPGSSIYVNVQPNNADNNVYARYFKLNAESDEFDYNGQAHSLDAATVGLRVLGENDIDITNQFDIKYSWVENGETKTSSEMPSRTEVGETKITVTATHKIFSSVTDSKEVTLKVNPIAINVTVFGNTAEEEYNGSEQSVTGFTVSAIGSDGNAIDLASLGLSVSLKEGKHAVAKGTNANTVSNSSYPMGLTAEDFILAGDTASNYNLSITSVTDGWLIIMPADLTIKIKGNSDEKVYNGETQYVAGFVVANAAELPNDVAVMYQPTVSTEPIEGATTPVVFAPTANGKNVGDYYMGLTADNFRLFGNSETNYKVTFQVTDGSLTITKAPLVLTSATLSKEYDGTALTNGDTALSTEEGWANGEGASYSFTGSVLLPGEFAANAFNVIPNSGTDLENYNITKNVGQLSIANRNAKYAVTVTANSTTATYDGTEKGASGFVGETVRGVAVTAANGQTYYVSGLASEAAGTDVADSVAQIPVVGTAVVRDAAGNDVTAQFAVTATPGSLTINKRDVTLKSADLEKPYDGTALTNGDTALSTEEGWVSGQGATYEFTGSQTLVGESKNAFSYKLNEGTNPDNYNISKTEGALTVKDRADKYAVTVTANSTTATYDGTEKGASGFVGETARGVAVTAANGKTYYVSGLASEAAGTDVADSVAQIPVVGTAVVRDAAGNDVTAQFAVTATPGSLTINKRNVTLTSATDTKEYDGTAIGVGQMAVGGDGFVGEEGATYTFDNEGKIVEVTPAGTKGNNTFEYALKANTKPGNYNVTTVFGTLTITASDDNAITGPTEVTDDNGMKVLGVVKTYDGKPATVAPTAKVAETQFAYSTDGGATWGELPSFVDAGTYTVQVKASAANYEDVVETATVVINKRNVTLTSATDTKEYDGTAIGVGQMAVGGDGFVGEEGATYTYDNEGKIVEVTPAGTKGNNTFEYALKANTKASNYNVERAYGTLTVTASDDNAITGPTEVTDDNGMKVLGVVKTYDGKPATVAPTAKVAETQFAYSTDGGKTWGELPSYVKVGNYTVMVKGVAANYEDVVETATVVINKRPLELTGASDVRVYNGEEQTVSGYSITSGSLADGQELKANHTAAGTIVDTHTGEFNEDDTQILVIDDQEDTTANYAISHVPGKLKIVDQSIDPNDPKVVDPENPDQPVYLGVTIEWPQNVVYNGQEQRQSVVIRDMNGNVLPVSAYNVTYSDDVTNAGTVKVTVEGQNGYAGTVEGSYEITPAPLTIVVNNAGKQVGQADPELTGYIAYGTIYGNDLSDLRYVRINNAETAGTYVDALTADYEPNPNYDITVQNGTFVIAPADQPVVVPPTPVPPAPVVPGPGVAAPVPAAAPAAEVIPDDANPMAETPEGEGEEEIVDDETPMSAYDLPHCWVHWLMLFGMLLTAAYAVGVIAHRSGNRSRRDDFEDQVLGRTDEKHRAYAPHHAGVSA